VKTDTGKKMFLTSCEQSFAVKHVDIYDSKKLILHIFLKI